MISLIEKASTKTIIPAYRGEVRVKPTLFLHWRFGGLDIFIDYAD